MRRMTVGASVVAVLAAMQAVAVPADVNAQEARSLPRTMERVMVAMQDDRPMIGITPASDSEREDTLGLRVEEVTKDSPAEKAGIKPGDRLQSVNGVSLRADAGDAGQEDYAGVLLRRLQREVQKAKEGESLELRVLSGSQARTVRVTPLKGSEVMKNERREGVFSFTGADRKVLGLMIAPTGTKRDTLGMFVQSVTKGGPAEKAGIIEGDRIASINGVILKVSPEDAEDRSVGSSRVERLRSELDKLEEGKAAEIVVVSGGRSRTVRATPVKATELPNEPMSWNFNVPEGAGLRSMRVVPRAMEMPRTPETPPSMVLLRRRTVI